MSHLQLLTSQRALAPLLVTSEVSLEYLEPDPCLSPLVVMYLLRVFWSGTAQGCRTVAHEGQASCVAVSKTIRGNAFAIESPQQLLDGRAPTMGSAKRAASKLRSKCQLLLGFGPAYRRVVHCVVWGLGVFLCESPCLQVLWARCGSAAAVTTGAYLLIFMHIAELEKAADASCDECFVIIVVSEQGRCLVVRVPS